MAKGAGDIDGVPCAFDEYTGIALDGQWLTIKGADFWYEKGVRQGLDGRGKEIYDPASDAWYWLDAVDQGKKATSKDVYQESEAGQWADRADGTGKWVRYDAQGHMIKAGALTSVTISTRSMAPWLRAMQSSTAVLITLIRTPAFCSNPTAEQ